LQEAEAIQLPIEVGSPRTLCFLHASEIMEVIWTYRKAFSLHHSSCVGLLGPYMVVLTLCPQLRDGPHKNEAFVRACQALAEHADNFPVAPYVLAMLKALDMEYQFGFPDDARAILRDSNLHPDDLDDIPMEMRITVPPRDRGAPPTSESVGELLARWAGPSAEDSQ
jgi:hypothetical protein